jgi:hypothetical protein
LVEVEEEGFHPIKNLQNCDQDFVAPFNSNFHNKTLCESGVMGIFRFVTYLSIVFHIYLGLFQEKIPSRVGMPLIFFYLGGGRKTYFFSGGCCQISI